MAEKIATRAAYGKALVALAEQYPGLSQSVAQVFHTTDERVGELNR